MVSRMSSYFPNRWPLSYLNLTKNMKTYIRRQQHKHFKHQDIKQKEPPKKYRLGTISNAKLLAGLNQFYLAITSPSSSANQFSIFVYFPGPEELQLFHQYVYLARFAVFHGRFKLDRFNFCYLFTDRSMVVLL